MGQRYPLPITPAMLADSNVNAGKPRYSGAGATADWAGGVVLGDDPGLPVAGIIQFRAANVAVANSSGGANTPDYLPRNQNQKRLAMVPPPAGVLDVGRKRGAVAPDQRYPLAGDAALPAPVVASLTPSAAVAGAAAVPLVVTITGTGFTPYSGVVTGGSGSPWDDTCKYISPTQLQIVIDPRSAVPGATSVAVVDHSVMSNTNVNFTFN